MSRYRQTWKHSSFSASISDPTRTVTAFPPYEDTFITNAVSQIPLQAYDNVSQKFVTVNDHDESGYSSSSTLYRERETIKIGASGDTQWRGVLILKPDNEIQKELNRSRIGITAGYTILNGHVYLTATPTSSKPPIKCSFLPFESGVDETVSWERSSDTQNGTTWSTPGGDVLPLATQTTTQGTWNQNTVVFDISQIIPLWKNSGKDTFPLLLWTEMPDGITELYSKNHIPKKLGNKTLLTCSFLRGGNENTFNTEGIRVSLTPHGAQTVVSYIDTRPEAQKSWLSLNNSVSLGNTFAFFAPDEEDGVVLGQSVCTLTGKRDGAVVVSGLTFPYVERFDVTAEFFGQGTVPEGVGILEISNSDADTATDTASLLENSQISVGYVSTSTPNNTGKFIVGFGIDERLKLNRSRIYLKKIPLAENRNGSATDIFVNSEMPNISVTLLTY